MKKSSINKSIFVNDYNAINLLDHNLDNAIQ